MASVVLGAGGVIEPPRKRQKLSPTTGQLRVDDDHNISDKGKEAQLQAIMAEQIEKESRVGILFYVNESNPGFVGTVKQRYTDFLVNEIELDGKVIHLTDIGHLPFAKEQHGVKKQNESTISEASSSSRVDVDLSVSTKVHGAETVIEKANCLALSTEGSNGISNDSTGISAHCLPPSTSEKGAIKLDIANSDIALTTEPEGVEAINNKIDDPAPSIKGAIGVPSDVAMIIETPTTFTGSPEDVEVLDSYFGPTIREAIVKLYEKRMRLPDAKPASFGSVSSNPMTDRQLRTKMHGDVRRIFNNALETASGADGVIKISVAPKKNLNASYGRGGGDMDARKQQAKGKLGWNELGGEYLHFSLYKENKDTLEVVSFLASRLRIAARQFGTAGTKDRRAVTVQRVSVPRIRADQLVGLNRILTNAKIGNFKHEKHGLQLGDLGGNEFLITLRDCQFEGDESVDEPDKLSYAHKVVEAAIGNLQRQGFLNYFGLQRFGTFGVGTEEVGKKILQGDFKGAVETILVYNEEAIVSGSNGVLVGKDGNPMARDDVARARAIHQFQTTGNAKLALDKMPRKFSGETHIIKHLQRRREDFLGALDQIPRSLKTMYVHAYQSFVWNLVASRRWDIFGEDVVEGDLILDDSVQNAAPSRADLIDENGEVVVLPAADDVAFSADDLFQRARPITAEEASSGKFSIFDIVLPTPGFDINYPDNEIGEFYKEFMASERGGGLDPANMRRPHKDFSLSGSYRKLMGQIGTDVSFEVKLYTEPNEQMVRTDLEKIMNGKRDPRRASPDPEAAKIQEANKEQQRAWNKLPAQLAVDDKTEADAHEAQKAANTGKAKEPVDQPVFKETFIETSADGAGRTGHRLSTLTFGVDALTAAAEDAIMADLPTVLEEGTTTATDGSHEVAKVQRSRRNTGQSQSRKYSNASNTSDGSATVVPFDPKDLGKRFRNKRQAVDALDDAVAVSRLNKTERGVDVTGSADQVAKGNEAVKEATNSDPEKVDTTQEDLTALAAKSEPKRIAVIVKFQLQSSVYATMALRELMKVGGARGFRPAFHSTR